MKLDIKIGPYNWVYSDEEDLKEEKCLGTSDYDNLTICITKDIRPQIKKVTIIHELIHSFFSSSGFHPKEEENICDTLANQIVLFLKQNDTKTLLKLLGKFK